MENADNKNSIAAELLQLMQRVDYCRTIKPLKLMEAVMIADFAKIDLSTLFELDTLQALQARRN